MKKILNIVMLVILTACSNSNNSPERTVRDAVRCLHDNDFNGYLQHVRYGKRMNMIQNLWEMVQFNQTDWISDEVVEVVGMEDLREIDQYLIDSERATQPDFDMRRVKTIIRCRNGREHEVIWLVVRQDGEWLLEEFNDRRRQI